MALDRIEEWLNRLDDPSGCNSSTIITGEKVAEARGRKPKNTLSRPQPAAETARASFEPAERPQNAAYLSETGERRLLKKHPPFFLQTCKKQEKFKNAGNAEADLAKNTGFNRLGSVFLLQGAGK
jgi:hypothetical protein